MIDQRSDYDRSKEHLHIINEYFKEKDFYDAASLEELKNANVKIICEM